jgi:hypothetical protein
LDREYKNVIFTQHALQRMKLRRINQEMVVTAIRRPDKQELEGDGDTKFIKLVDGRSLHVVSKYLNEDRKWLVISTWVRGEDDPKPLWLQILMLPVRLVQGLLKGNKKPNRRSNHRR